MRNCFRNRACAREFDLPAADDFKIRRAGRLTQVDAFSGIRREAPHRSGIVRPWIEETS